MINKPVTFFLLNVIAFCIGLTVGGFPASTTIFVCLGLVGILHNIRLIGIWDSMALTICYMMIFDAEPFSFSALNIRIWYAFLIPLLFYHLWNRHFFLKLPRNGNSVIFLIFLILTAFWLILDPLDGKLSIIKYAVFSMGTIFCLKESFRSIGLKIGLKKLIDYFISIATFVGIWGIFQFLANLKGQGIKYQYDYYNIRPSAFFSETTWYAEYLVFGLIFTYYMLKRSGQKIYTMIIPVFLIGIALSVTRNAFLAIVIWGFIAFGLALLRKKITPLNPFLSGTVIVAIVVASSYWIDTKEISGYMNNKFSFQDDSAQGRIEALHSSIDRIKASPFIGHGFGFDPGKDRIFSSGTSIGAKNSNLFLMIAHILGLTGLLMLLYLLTDFVLKQACKWIKNNDINSKYAIIFILTFCSMSMFAPLHQFPFGMFIVASALTFAYPFSEKHCTAKSETGIPNNKS